MGGRHQEPFTCDSSGGIIQRSLPLNDSFTGHPMEWVPKGVVPLKRHVADIWHPAKQHFNDVPMEGIRADAPLGRVSEGRSH